MCSYYKLSAATHKPIIGLPPDYAEQYDHLRDSLAEILIGITPAELGTLLGRARTRVLIDTAADEALADLLALSARDPAAIDGEHILRGYASFFAVLTHRFAHQIVMVGSSVGAGTARSLGDAARKLAEEAKVATGVEIHPAAKIGPRFVVDHGIGTVIGETTEIGADCYLLQGVVLGARGIAGNPRGKRHPTIGDHVEMGSFARVLGPVTVGSFCILDPHVVITGDVPTGQRVRLVTQCQFVRSDSAPTVTGVRLCPGRIAIWGIRLGGCVLTLHESQGRQFTVELEEESENLLRAQLPTWAEESAPDITISRPGRRADVTLIRLKHFWREKLFLPCGQCEFENVIDP